MCIHTQRNMNMSGIMRALFISSYITCNNVLKGMSLLWLTIDPVISCYGWVLCCTHPYFVPSSLDIHLGCFYSLDRMNSFTMWVRWAFPLGYILGSRILIHMVILYLILFMTLPNGNTGFHTSLIDCWIFVVSFKSVEFFNLVLFKDCSGYSGSICISWYNFRIR